MKKILVSMFLLIFGLCLVGCELIGTNIKLDDILPITKIEITKYDVSGGNIVNNITLEDMEQINYICNNFTSLKLRKFTGPNKPTSIEYNFVFFNNDNEVEIIGITAQNWIDYRGRFHSIEQGEIDFNYINTLFRNNLNLTIQNETDYELIGIKKKYKAGEEVEVKMIYEDAVVSYVHLNGKNIGWLNGTNSLKFNMPNEDSVLTINYSESKLYKLHIIDNFNLIGKQLNDYYVYGERIAFPVSYELYDTIKVTVNGVLKEGIPPLMSNYNCKIYSFNMPENDCEVIIYVNGLSDYSCKDNLHHYEEEIIKVEETDSYIKKSICKLCGKTIEEEITKIKLNTKTIFYNHYSNGNLFEEFVSEFKVSNKRYLIIDNVDTYFNVYPNIPNIGNEFFDKQEADEFFKDNIMVLHIRYISGTMDFISVNYFYNIENFDICKEYVKNVPEIYPQVFLGNTIDIITIPKEYYNEIIK